MNRIIISFYLLAITLTAIACERNTYSDPIDNIELTSLTKDIITLYLEDSLVIDNLGTDDEITLVCFPLDTCSSLSLWSNNSEQYRRDCYENYVGEDVKYLGKTAYHNYCIRVFGMADSLFFSVLKDAPKQGRCIKAYYEYDPIEWYICINADGSLFRERSYLLSADHDLSSIDSLLNRNNH